uniref:Uncharacterized protein n=1 Tax=Anguilla anguilla TaxID=7936 RepID=A0A0E9VF88_ANGAN
MADWCNAHSHWSMTTFGLILCFILGISKKP